MENRIKYTLMLLGAMFFIFVNHSALAQDGAAIFKAKCSACHIMGKDGTGPNLQGVKSKWEGEEDHLYDWVLNSPKVIAEGKSQRALEVKDYSQTVMPIQDVTLEEAKAIIEYVDVWEPEVASEVNEEKGETKIVMVPNYKWNLKLFYILLVIVGFLLLSILIVSKSTSSLIKSDLFRERIIEIQKEKKSNGNTLNAILAIVFLGWSGAANALTFEVPQLAKDKELFMYVENSDLYVLLIIIILLLGFLLHTVRMFYGVLKVIKPSTQTTPEKIQARIKERKAKRSRLAQALTGATPIEEEHKIDLGHDYDGIRELDNPMPPWWLAGFFISIIFAVIYMFHYHVLGTGDLQEVEYEKSMAKAKIEVDAYLSEMAMNVDETNATLMIDKSDLMSGKSIFINNCATCHKEDGRGEVGPNLTDDYWIYGGDIKDVFDVIKNGAPNGMPEHSSKLNPIQIQQVSSYVLHFELITKEQGGKKPEGELYKPTAEVEEALEESQRTGEREDMLMEEVEDIVE